RHAVRQEWRDRLRFEKDGIMESKNPGSTPSGSASVPGSAAPELDVMLGVWSSWMDAAFSSAQQWSNSLGEFGAQWWQITPDASAGDMLASGVQQLNDILVKDPILHAIHQMWNANPLRDVVPVDWAEIASSLRTIWLRSLRQPGNSIASAADLNARLVSTATEIWNDTYRRWC